MHAIAWGASASFIYEQGLRLALYRGLHTSAAMLVQKVVCRGARQLCLMSAQDIVGPLPRLCTGTGTKLKHPHRSEYKRPRDSKDQHADQRDQDQTREAGYRQEKSLPCWAGEPGKGQGHPQEQTTKAPWRGLPGSLKQNHLTNHSTTTDVYYTTLFL